MPKKELTPEALESWRDLNIWRFKELLDNTDWAELRAQKNALAQHQGEDWAEGLLSFLDHIQDAAAELGYPVYPAEPQNHGENYSV